MRVRAAIKYVGPAGFLAFFVWLTGIHDAPTALAFARNPGSWLATYSPRPPSQPVGESWPSAEATTREIAVGLAPPSKLGDGPDPLPSASVESRVNDTHLETTSSKSPQLRATAPVGAADEYDERPSIAPAVTEPPLISLAKEELTPPPLLAAPVPQPIEIPIAPARHARGDANGTEQDRARCWRSAYVPRNCP